MSTTKKAGGVAYHLGHRVGRVWRGLASREQRAVAWLVDHGWAPGLARTLPWAIKLLVVGTLIYAAFWLALVLVFAVFAGCIAEHSIDQDESDLLGRKSEELDHREGLFYHPYNYNDDPDPRFEDD